LKENPLLKYINLEPWYEGILKKFYSKDQLYAYWVSMLAGAHAYCYGAHGIWNCSDGKFLSQWGKQTFEEALQLKTPKLLGLSHKIFMESGAIDYPFVEVDVKKNTLISICRKNRAGDFLQYFPKFGLQKGLYSSVDYFFNPLKGEYLNKPEQATPLVIKGKVNNSI
jgi:hypothetical protein